MVKKKANKTSGLAIASLILGILSFFPGLGILIGIIAVILGIVALINVKKEKLKGRGMAIAGIILGILGVLFTLLLYGSLFYMLSNPEAGGSFTESRIELSKQLLQQTAGSLELYKTNFGNYPENLEELAENEYFYYPIDHFMNPVQYTLSADKSSYELRTAGVDKELNTEDDLIYP